MTHKEKVNLIIKQLKRHRPGSPLSLKKKSVSHQVPKPQDRRYSDEKIDLSRLNEILEIDKKNMTCVAEPGVTFEKLVKETIKYGLIPIIVPELKTITIGGAVAGCSIESMSYKYGGFHDTCLAYEMITAKGELLNCTPDNENKLIFQMLHGTFGTLGIISKIKFKLIQAKKFVKVNYEQYDNLKDYKQAIWKYYKNKSIDFMDGIIHSPHKFILSLGNFVEQAPYTHKYEWMKIYYLSTLKRKEDFLTTSDYFFRYNKGVTNVHPKSFLGRLFFGKLTNSTRTLKLANKFHRIISDKLIPITLDTFIPFSKFDEFMQWYEEKINHFPLWCVPYKVKHKYEWIADELLAKSKDELFIDIAIYGMHRKNKAEYYKILENKLMEIGGIKTLISSNYYTPDDFWKNWHKKNYYQVKSKTDPDNIFRDLYTKMCKTSMGI